jgi:glycopeptide antibiotics resistance protein
MHSLDSRMYTTMELWHTSLGILLIITFQNKFEKKNDRNNIISENVCNILKYIIISLHASGFEFEIIHSMVAYIVNRGNAHL